MEDMIMAILNEICGAEQDELEPDLDLFEAGLLDSFGVAQLLVELLSERGYPGKRTRTKTLITPFPRNTTTYGSYLRFAVKKKSNRYLSMSPCMADGVITPAPRQNADRRTTRMYGP